MKADRHDVFLMCPPQHFAVSYIINPWMEGNVAQDDHALAVRQWQALRDGLAQVAQVLEVPPAAGVPDMVFTANAGLVVRNQVVLSRFRHAERQPEEPLFKAWFDAYGLQVRQTPPTLPFEGAGDALLDRSADLLWLGYGHRTDVGAARLLAGWLDIEVQSLRLIDSRFYHLDTCFCPLEGGDVMYYPAAFDAPSRQAIERRVPPHRRIMVEEADAMAFACNAVNAGRHVFLNHASDSLAQQLAARRFEVHRVSLSEFMKAGGAAKCLTLRLNEPRRISRSQRVEEEHARCTA